MYECDRGTGCPAARAVGGAARPDRQRARTRADSSRVPHRRPIRRRIVATDRRRPRRHPAIGMGELHRHYTRGIGLQCGCQQHPRRIRRTRTRCRRGTSSTSSPRDELIGHLRRAGHLLPERVRVRCHPARCVASNRRGRGWRGLPTSEAGDAPDSSVRFARSSRLGLVSESGSVCRTRRCSSKRSRRSSISSRIPARSRPRHATRNHDYLIALARSDDVDVVVSGDKDLLEWNEQRPPVMTPAATPVHHQSGPLRDLMISPVARVQFIG